MEATFTTLTDQQRVTALNNIFKAGLTTPKENLSFSTDKLVYLKPFLAKLQSSTDYSVPSFGNMVMVRQIVDDLLQDIMSEVEATCVRTGQNVERLAVDLGLQMFAQQTMDFFYTSKVA